MGVKTYLQEQIRLVSLSGYDLYTEEEYAVKKGFGHSTAEAGKRIQQESGAERLLLIHHAPTSTDKILLEREQALPEGVSYAREGECICL